MVEVDIVTVLVPSLIIVAFSLITISMKKFSKTSEGTLTGTIRLEHVNKELVNVEEKMDKGFEKVGDLINKKDEDHKKTFNGIFDTLKDMEATLKVHEWRLNEIDKSKQTGPKSAV